MEKKNPQNKERREERKSKVSIISFFICLGCSIILMIGSAIMPPPFVIDASIFKAVGWLFGFAALGQLPAIMDADKWAKITHGKTSLTIGDKDDINRRHTDYQRGPMDYDDLEEDNDQG